MLERRTSVFILATVAAACAILATAPLSGAVEAGATMPPVVGGGGGGGNVGGAPPANDPNAPAPGAQPAAPAAVGELPQVDVAAANPADVAADAAAVPIEEVPVGGDIADPAAVDPVPVVANPSPAPVAVDATPSPVVDGGGTDGAGGGGANVAGPPLATPAGALPFTGLAENLLIISIAGMLVPIGVLLYCAARRGDLRILHRQLAMPRFQWADPAQRPFQRVERSGQSPAAGPLRWPGS